MHTLQTINKLIPHGGKFITSEQENVIRGIIKLDPVKIMLKTVNTFMKNTRLKIIYKWN